MSFREKNDTFSGILKFGAIFLIALFGTIVCLRDASYTFKGETKNGNEMLSAGETLKTGEYITIDIPYLTPSYAKLTTKRARTFSKTETYYYLAWLDDGSLISVAASEQATLNKLNDYADKWNLWMNDETSVEPDPIQITGKISKLDSDVESYISGEVVKAKQEGTVFPHVYYYQINADTSRTGAQAVTIICILATLAFGFLTVTQILNYVSVSKTAANPTLIASGVGIPENKASDPVFGNLYASNQMSTGYVPPKEESKMDTSEDDIASETPKSSTGGFKLKDL